MAKQSYLFQCNNTIRSEKFYQHFQEVISKSLGAELETQLTTAIGSKIFNKIYLNEDAANIFRLIKSRWFFLQDIALGSNIFKLSDILLAREFINEGFQSIILCFLISNNPRRKAFNSEGILLHINFFFSSVVPIEKLSDDVLVKVISVDNKTSPYYHYVHALLEVWYYLLVLYYICGTSTEIIEKYLNVVIKQLGHLAKVNYTKYNNSLLETQCSCMHCFWLSVQLLTEKINPNGSLFWRIFNNSFKLEKPTFALIVLEYAALLQCYNDQFENIGVKSKRIRENFEFLDYKMKELLQQADCNQLLQTFKIVGPILSNIWIKDAKIDIYQIIWDFYSKRLNVSSRNTCNVPAHQLIEILDSVLLCPQECTEDFEMFVGFLVHYLREYPNQWSKIKGRIYSQLGPNKLKELSEVGIRHVFILFLALNSIYFEELEKKLIVFFDNLSREKKSSALAWNLFSCMIIKYVREGHSVEKIVPPIINMLQEASTNQKMFHLLREFIKNLETIVKISSSMQLYQWLLIGPWLGKYQNSCSYADFKKSLEVILLLLENCSDADSWPLWEGCFKEIYLNLRTLAMVSNSPSIIGKIAAKLALQCTSLTSEAFNYFNSENMSAKISLNFLEVLLENYPEHIILTSQQENIILQSWIRIGFITVEPLEKLTQNVIKLDIFPLMLKTHLKVAVDPIVTFIEYLESTYKQQKMLTHDTLKLCDLAFGQLDKAIIPYLSKAENENVIEKIFHYTSLAFLKCGNLLYNKNKTVTPFTKLTQALILPTEFMLGKKNPHSFVLNAIKKTWHVFFEACISLNVGNDLYLERTLKDMVIKYMPYFSTTDSPIATCLENKNYAVVIMEKLYMSYFKPPVKEPDANVLKALKIISNLVQNCTSKELLKVVISKIFYGLFELVIFHTQQNAAISVIKIVISSYFFSQFTEEFKEAVLAVTDKNLNFHTNRYFQLMNCLAKFAPQEIKNLLGEIKINVEKVEKLRGVGFDKTLRIHLEKLQNSLPNG